MRDSSQQELLDEMPSFPVGQHDDLLDAAAFGTAFLLDRGEPRVFELSTGIPQVTGIVRALMQHRELPRREGVVELPLPFWVGPAIGQVQPTEQPDAAARVNSSRVASISALFPMRVRYHTSIASRCDSC